MCLGPDGFGFCDAKTLWILAYTHPAKKTKAIVSMLAPEAERMCLGSSSGGWFSSLRPVGVSKCVDGAYVKQKREGAHFLGSCALEDCMRAF